MNKKRLVLPLLAIAGALFVWAQGDSIIIKIIGAGGKGEEEYECGRQADRANGWAHSRLLTTRDWALRNRCTSRRREPQGVPGFCGGIGALSSNTGPG